MRKPGIFSHLLIVSAVLTASSSFAQLQNRNTPVAALSKSSFGATGGVYYPEWAGTMKVSSREAVNDLLDAPYCKDCGLDGEVVNLPYYETEVEVGANEEIRIVSADGVNPVEEGTAAFRRSVQEAGLDAGTQWYPEVQAVAGSRTQRGNRFIQRIRLYPAQISGDGGTLRKCEAVKYTFTKVRRAARPMSGTASAASYAGSSVLAAGQWVKIGVTSEGIYKIDRTLLTSMGIDPATVDPRTIKLYGTGGGMLSQVVGAPRFDDLPENAIMVTGESDGAFDAGDVVYFYGASPHKWKYFPSESRWFHFFNTYSDTTFYFLTAGGATGKRINTLGPDPGVTFTPSYGLNYAFHENDSYNSLLSGRVWLGESFDLVTSKTFSFGTGPLAPGSSVDLHVRVGSRSDRTVSSFNIRENGAVYASCSVPAINTTVYGSYYYRSNWTYASIPASAISDESVDVEMEYVKAISSAVGYLDFIEVQYRRQLDLDGGSSLFYNIVEGTGPGQVAQHNIQGGNSSFRIWDVTDATSVSERSYTVSGSALSFSAAADTIRRYVAWTTGGEKSPAFYKALPNQDLHRLITDEKPNYIIVTDSRFRASAERLAQFHRDEFGHTAVVATPGEIYNEFSSGSLDPTAIRDFFKMAYDVGTAAGRPLEYACLLGDGSYDYKGHIYDPGTYNLVPTYQSRKSQRPTECYVSDDYYGFLNDGEGYWGELSGLEAGVVDMLWWIDGDTNSLASNTYDLDISIGRIPVGTADEADYMVDKIINYRNNPDGMGPWRNRVILAADHKDADGVTHISQADSYSDDIDTKSPCTNVDKLYMDNYLMVSTASGTRFPDGKEALVKALNEGALIANYTGHGGEVGWSNSSILEVTDINSLENGNRMPAYITATCEFGRWDDPGRRAAAELLFLKEGNGSIAMFTTVRVVYSGPNYVLNTSFYRYVFTWDTLRNRMPTMGEVFSRTKNDSWLDGINNRNFTLMGDPGLPLAYPELRGKITEINGTPTSPGVIDTLSALTKVTVKGRIEDAAGTFLNTYNGDMDITILDKPVRFTTKRAPFTFFWQKNKLFKGKCDVTNGLFEFEFVVPLDISYDIGKGKFSLYFEDNLRDGAGCTSDIYFGGSDTASITDDLGPEIDLYLNDKKFADGNMVGPDPLMIADVEDDNGLNTAGTGIGHELTAILDGDEENVILLNDFYSAEKNTYKRGSIRYPFEDLESGEHTLRVKVWDVANNSSEAEIRFIVESDAVVALGHVLNYPNPFTTNTQFILEHNANGKLLDLTVKIYTVSGRLVKSLEDSFVAEGNLHCDLKWDGLDDYGDLIGRGVYVYQVTLSDRQSGEKATRFEKLVILR